MCVPSTRPLIDNVRAQLTGLLSIEHSKRFAVGALKASDTQGVVTVAGVADDHEVTNGGATSKVALATGPVLPTTSEARTRRLCDPASKPTSWLVPKAPHDENSLRSREQSKNLAPGAVQANAVHDCWSGGLAAGRCRKVGVTAGATVKVRLATVPSAPLAATAWAVNVCEPAVSPLRWALPSHDVAPPSHVHW